MAAFLRLSNPEALPDVVSLNERPNADKNNDHDSKNDIPHRFPTMERLALFLTRLSTCAVQQLQPFK